MNDVIEKSRLYENGLNIFEWAAQRNEQRIYKWNESKNVQNDKLLYFDRIV